MDTPPPQRPPEAQLIYEYRIKAELSVREAARRAGISEGSWRRTESSRPLTRTPETLARMASVIKVTAQQLAEAGRRDAGECLARLPQTQARQEPLDELADLVKRAGELADRLRREGGNERTAG